MRRAETNGAGQDKKKWLCEDVLSRAWVWYGREMVALCLHVCAISGRGGDGKERFQLSVAFATALCL